LHANTFAQGTGTLRVVAEPFEGVFVLEPKVFSDERGFFLESYQGPRFSEFGIRDNFLQDNHSRSHKNVLRGLHFTKKVPQSQLLTVMHGKIFDVLVDLRKNSSTFGKWFGTELSAEGTRQVYMPHGIAHGFCVLSDVADLQYKVSHLYDPSDEGGIVWNDPDLAIEWPVTAPIVSARDQAHPEWNVVRNEC
jgi:dTDP-4-dehydrorhamnose 3,5-epimerase